MHKVDDPAALYEVIEKGADAYDLIAEARRLVEPSQLWSVINNPEASDALEKNLQGKTIRTSISLDGKLRIYFEGGTFLDVIA